jgi:hypothetical protein
MTTNQTSGDLLLPETTAGQMSSTMSPQPTHILNYPAMIERVKSACLALMSVGLT